MPILPPTRPDELSRGAHDHPSRAGAPGAHAPKRPPAITPERRQLWTTEKRQRLRTHAGLVSKCISDRAYQYGQLQVYARDVRVKRGFRGLQGAPPGGERGAVTGLSRQSRSRLIFTSRNLVGLTHMVTLTYPAEYTNSGRRVKRDWAAFRKWMRRAAPGIAGLWVLEFQDRGAPHLHVFLTGALPKKRVSAAWYRIVGSGDEKHLRAGTRVEELYAPTAVATYASKYAAKWDQKGVPEEFQHVGRMWALFGGLRLKRHVVHGRLRQVAPLLRVVRRVRDLSRRRWGHVRRRDGGRRGFVAWDAADATRYLLARERRASQGGGRL